MNYRTCKETLRSKVLHMVEPYLNDDGVIDPASYQAVKKSLHTDVASDVIDSSGPDRVLQARPPLVHPSEKYLPRLTSTTMNQLRSGHCVRLKSYLFRLGRVDDDLCPECGLAPHTTDHLFDCPSYPTSLVADDLWEKPWDTAAFLQTLPSFNFFPCPGPPPPPPPQPSRRRRNRKPPPEPPPNATGGP